MVPSLMKGHVFSYFCDNGMLPKPGGGGGVGFAWGVWPGPVCHVGFCNGGTIYEEEKKMLLGTVAKNEEC